MSGENIESFFARLRPHYTRREMSYLKLAYQLAKFNHRWQTRKQTDDNGKPIRYFEHLRGVALILIDEVGCILPEMVIAALMHDSLEDAKDVSDDDLEIWFGLHGMEVSRIVRLLSKRPDVDYLQRLSAFGDWRVLLLKACDRLHNLRSLESCDPAFQHKQGDETLLHYIHLLDRMFYALPERFVKNAARIMFEIEKLAEYYCSPGTKIPDPAPAHWRYYLLVKQPG